MPRWIGSMVLSTALAASGLACNTGVSTPTSVIVPTNATISTITVNGVAPTIGGTAQFTAIATLADGTTLDVTALATWRSTNAADASVSTSGVVTSFAAGTVTVVATYQNVTGSLDISIAS